MSTNNKNTNLINSENKNQNNSEKKENQRIDVNAILSIGDKNLIQNVRGGATLYKKELFVGMNDKEKKHFRIKLRRKLENFIASAFEFSATKKENNLKELKNNWVEYANQIYVDINNIIDANASEQKRKDVFLFLDTMNKTK